MRMRPTFQPTSVFVTYQDRAQLGLEARSRGRFSSNVNGTTVCVSHVSGITGARRVIEGNIEYGYSWIICGWTSNSGLNLTVACWAIAVEAKMSIDPAARANCTDFGIVFLRKGAPSRSRGAGAGASQSTGTTLLARRLIQGLWIQQRGEEKVVPHAMI